ncbi:MAG: type II secretion system major pseudopilin GspG [Pseudobdellovibrionaceae bacterium]
MQMQKLKNSRGMTLLEIMIVLAILGSLMAVLLPQFMGAQDKSKVKETGIIMSQLVTSLNMYYTDCGKYPESLDGLVKADAACANWGPEAYRKNVPTDPWGTPFAYSVEGGSFIIKSLGKDKKEGGDGYAKDISSEDMQ